MWISHRKSWCGSPASSPGADLPPQVLVWISRLKSWCGSPASSLGVDLPPQVLMWISRLLCSVFFTSCVFYIICVLFLITGNRLKSWCGSPASSLGVDLPPQVLVWISRLLCSVFFTSFFLFTCYRLKSWCGSPASSLGVDLPPAVSTG